MLVKGNTLRHTSSTAANTIDFAPPTAAGHALPLRQPVQHLVANGLGRAGEQLTANQALDAAVCDGLRLEARPHEVGAPRALAPNGNVRHGGSGARVDAHLRARAVEAEYAGVGKRWGWTRMR
jgi:hypothetical protein